MGIGTSIKKFAIEKAVNTILAMATRPKVKDPRTVVLKGLNVAKTFTKDKLWSAVLDGIIQKFKDRHPLTELCNRFLQQTNPNVRKKIVKHFFIEEALLGHELRHKLEDDLGFYPPGLIAISPSMACPLKCYGCYAGMYDKSQSLTFEQVDKIVNESRDIGIKFIIITGGEPYCWEPLFDIFEKHSDIVFQTYTNGMFITDEMVDKLGKFGNVFPAISCEGFEKETDERRGAGAFKKVNETMDKLKDAGVMFGFSATATRNNIDVVSSDEFVDYWSGKGCLFGWYFIYMPIGTKPNLDMMPTPEQRLLLGTRVKSVRSRKNIMVMDFWNDGEHVGGCIAGGRKYLHVNNKGDYEACVFCHFAQDNISDKSLVEALRGDFFRAFRAGQPFNKDLRRPCIMIDNPHCLRDVVEKTGARWTHKGADTMIKEFADPLDKYAEEFGEVLKNGPVTQYKIHA